MKPIVAFSSSQKRNTVFFHIQVTYPLPCPTTCSDPAWILIRVSGGREPEGVAGLWQTGGHRTEPDLSQTHATGSWKDQRREYKTSPTWNAHPSCKPVGWCLSSLCKETNIYSLILRGPLKDCPRCLPFHLAFRPGTEASSVVIILNGFFWAPLLGMFLSLLSPSSFLNGNLTLPGPGPCEGG